MRTTFYVYINRYDILFFFLEIQLFGNLLSVAQFSYFIISRFKHFRRLLSLATAEVHGISK